MNTVHILAPRLVVGLGLLALLGSIGLASMRPAHTAGGPVPVTIANTVQNKDLDNPARQPVQASENVSGALGDVLSGTVYLVPTGKRLVVEYASASSNISGDKNVYSVEIDAGSSNYSSAYLTVTPNGTPFAALSQPVRLYADAGTTVGMTVYSSRANASKVTVTITGYLVDVP